MTRTRSRHRATARRKFSESTQNPPSPASDSVISTTARTATRPSRGRSRTASPIRNPSTPSPLVFHDPSAPERDRPSPEHPHEIGSVSGQHDGRAARPDVPEHVEDLGLHRLVEIPRRLVREEEWRFAHDRPSERRALSLALRELGRIGLGAGGEAHHAERVEDALGDLAPGRPQHTQDEGDVLVDGAHREELRVLEDDADRPPERGHRTLPEPPEIVAEHLDVALGGEIVAIEEPQQRRLARARWSGQDDEFALGDPEADIAQRRDLHRPDRVHLPDANNLNHGGASLVYQTA